MPGPLPLALHAALLLLAPARVLTLDEALRIAEQNQPQLRLARANSEVARARVGEARAAILPQLQGTATYQRTTANFAQRPGLLPQMINTSSAPPTFQTFNFWSFGLSLSQYLFDLRAPFAFRASATTAEAQQASERYARGQVLLGVRVAYFAAQAQLALVAVAREALANQARHREQVRGFVEVGRQPEIAQAQVEADYQNARVQLVNAENNYAVSRVQLDLAMGVEAPGDYQVAGEPPPPVEGEEAPVEALVAEAVRARSDLRSLELSLRAQGLAVKAQLGGYGPSISFGSTFTDVGTSLDQLTWNWNASVNASWLLFDGLLNFYQVREARATEAGLGAQRDALRQQVGLDVSQAALGVRAALVARSAAEQSLTNARERLRLAEGRFAEGVGNIIELDDAQLAATQSSAQKVQTDFSLATARAQLLRALGR